MTPSKFLSDLLDSQDLSPEQERDLESHKKEVTAFLREKFGTDPVIKYAGSHEKGTMICEKYDLDIVCYFPSSDNRSLKEIRDDVAQHLTEKYLTTPKASAERIIDLKGATAPDDFHIDVVPGRFIEDSKDVFLHVSYGEKERMQTNLKTHIDHIANSGCVPIIRLVKLWACRNHVDIKTFVLELFVVKILSGSQNKSDLKKSFIEVLQALRDKFRRTELEDPANSNNVVSRLLTDAEKMSVANAAEEALNTIEESDNVADWRTVFHEESDDYSTGPVVTSTPPNTGFVPRSPHCNLYAYTPR